MNASPIMVSVYTLVYNHEPYIRKALESFVTQKTNFKFEIIVHDDASTDNSAAIIQEYAERYPNIIKPIFQTENQYSKGINIFTNYIAPKARGKYIAICEGDDCWVSTNKLQKQFDFLEFNSDFVACAHNTKRLNYSHLFHYSKIMYPKKDQELSLNDILYGGYHTSSIMYRREYLFNRPVFLTMQPGVGDFPLAIFLQLSGKIMRFGSVMSLYRLAIKGSWSYRQKKDIRKQIQNTNNAMKMLKAANEWSQYKYNSEFEDKILYLEFINLLREKKIKEAIKEPYSKFWKKESIVGKIKIWIKILLIK